MKYFLALLITIFSCNQIFAQYTEQDIYQYIDTYKELAIQKMNEHKIPASITLAQGVFESACGTSRLAKEGNNHFGIKCHKEWVGDTIIVDDDELGECFRKYENAEESFNDHSLFLTGRSRYNELFKLDIMDYQAWAKGLKAAGYATNPQYAERLISLINRFNIARHDTTYYQRYVIGNMNAGKENLLTEKPKKMDMHNKELIFEKAENVVKVEEVQGEIRKETLYFSATPKEYKQVKYPFANRDIFENNRTYFVIVKEGDTYKSIAADVQDSEKNIRKYNEVLKKVEPSAGEVVYIEQKSKFNSIEEHEVKQGETVHYISQKYAIQRSYLLKYNNLTENAIIYSGNKIKLKN